MKYNILLGLVFSVILISCTIPVVENNQSDQINVIEQQKPPYREISTKIKSITDDYIETDNGNDPMVRGYVIKSIGPFKEQFIDHCSSNIELIETWVSDEVNPENGNYTIYETKYNCIHECSEDYMDLGDEVRFNQKVGRCGL